MAKNGFKQLITIAALAAASTVACGMSGTDIVATDGKPVDASWAKGNGFPDGTLALINDRSRATGWSDWFSGCPNDVFQYGYRIRSASDVNHLLNLFSQLKAANARVILTLPYERMDRHHRTKEPYYATFMVGSPVRRKQWHERLNTRVKDGKTVRVHGVNSLPIHFPVTPPTLTLYIHEEIISLKQLKLPASVRPLVLPIKDEIDSVRRAVLTRIHRMVARHIAANDTAVRNQKSTFADD